MIYRAQKAFSHIKAQRRLLQLTKHQPKSIYFNYEMFLPLN